MRVIAKVVYGLIIFLRWIVTIIVATVVARVIVAIVFEQRLTLNPTFGNKLEAVVGLILGLPLLIGIHNLLYRATLPIKRRLKIDWKDVTPGVDDYALY